MKKTFIAICCVLCLIICAICGTNIEPVYADTDIKVEGVKSAILMDYESGEVMYEYDADKHLPIASMVKLMTILLTFEEIDNGRLSLDDTTITSENASGMGGSQVFIDPNVEYKIEDLLKSVIVASANDASVALAEHICGSETSFVNKMNSRAKELGMNNTIYKNCTGLPAAEQYSCARDVSLLNRELLKHEDYHKYSTIWTDKLVHPSGRETELTNTNKLIRYYKDCDGGKTGSTDEAGCCLSATAKRNGMRIISTIVGAKDSKTRFNECSSLLNYGFANYENKTIVNDGDLQGSICVKGSKQSFVDGLASQSIVKLVKKGSEDEYYLSANLPETIKAPILKGDKIGELTLTKNGEVVQIIDIVASCDAKKLTFVEATQKIIEYWAI